MVRGNFKLAFLGLYGQVILTAGFLNKIFGVLSATLKRVVRGKKWKK
jgi:hypothetical protein